MLYIMIVSIFLGLSVRSLLTYVLKFTQLSHKVPGFIEAAMLLTHHCRGTNNPLSSQSQVKVKSLLNPGLNEAWGTGIIQFM